MTLVRSACPVCTGGTVAPVYPATIAADETRDAADYFSSLRRVAGHLPIGRCTGCGLMMTSVRDDDATLARVYAEWTGNEGEPEEPARRRNVTDALTLLGRYQSPPGCLLDAGCGTGRFVRAAQRVGWEAAGLDVSSWAVCIARRRCPGARFEMGLLPQVDVPAASVDVVTLWNVLEHLPQPLETLARIRTWLRPDGWLFLSMPDAESRIARLAGRRWVLLLREHLWYFSRATIARLLAGAGFTLAAVHPRRVSTSLAGIAARLAQSPGSARPIAGHLARLEILRGLIVRVPLGEMYVVARRAPGR